MASCCCCGGSGGCCCGGNCCNGNCADCFCGGSLTGCGTAPCGNPSTGSPVELGQLPLTNPNSDPALDPLTSPCCAGTSDPPPAASGPGACHTFYSKAGSGAGTAKSSLGGIPIPRPASCANQSQLSGILSSLGTALALKSVAPSPSISASGPTVSSVIPSSFGMIAIIVVIGLLLILLSFGKD